MKYFKLEHSTDPAEVGIMDQAQIALPYELMAWDSFNAAPLEGSIEYEMKIPKFNLDIKARLTDFLHSPALADRYLLISSKLFDILITQKMDEYQAFDVQLYKDQEVFPYHLLRFTNSRNTDYIDWKFSIFAQTTQFCQEIIKEVRFTGYEDFLSEKRALALEKKELHIRKLVFNEPIIEKDIFRLLFISTGTYISEDLKKVLLKANITGFKCIPVENLIALSGTEKQTLMNARAFN